MVKSGVGGARGINDRRRQTRQKSLS